MRTKLNSEHINKIIKQCRNMLQFKFSFLLLLFTGIIIVSCSRTEKDKFEKVVSFDRNFIETTKPELVCKLSEDSILLKNIVDFTVLSDSSFVVLDGRGAYLYDISGTFKKQFGNSGQARGEMISPSLVYATSDFVYIWCTSLMKFLIFDHEANFINELPGFKRAVKKFVVNSSNEIIYIYTSGFFDKSEKKILDVIDIYNIAEGTSKKYGERSPEDEVLSVFSNSGGLYADKDQFIYLYPSNLIIHNLSLNTNTTIQFKIEDKAFYTKKITSNARDIIGNRAKLTDYLLNNSVVKGLYKNNSQYIIVSEIGQYALDKISQVMNTQKRKIKLYILEDSFIPNRTILYDFISSPNMVIYSNSLYFITRINSDDQIFTLNRFSLLENK